MEIDFKIWSLEDLIKMQDKINPKPQYQRTSVWSSQKKKLLIDSILRGYDLPKFYIRQTPNDQTYEYEVTDGQQRMRSIWEFVDKDGYSLEDININGLNTKGVTYEKLKEDYNEIYLSFNKFELHIAVIKEATPEETRTLFARLQMGERLNPVELRHAIASNIGSAILSIVENHKFFEASCRIPKSRYKHQDYLDHVISLVYYKGEKNIKASELKQFYIELSSATLDQIQPMLKKTNKVLDLMKRINSHKKGIFKNKWAFVDTFNLLYSNISHFIDIKPKNFSENFVLFELKRREFNPEPEKLIEDKVRIDYDKNMYDYIIAFKTGGALKNNVKIRYRVFMNYFLKSDNFIFNR